MVRRPTLVLLVVFAALVAGAIFWQRSQDKKSPADATATPGSQLLLDLKGSNITGFRLEGAGGTVVELSRDAEDVWTLVYPKAEATDAAAVRAAMSQLVSAPVLSTLEEGPTLEAAGLAIPAYRLLINLDNGSQVVMNVGNGTPTGSGYYVLVSQQGMSIVNKYSLEPLLKLLENPPVMLPATPTAGDPILPELSLTPAP
jgi:hypothetical protein